MATGDCTKCGGWGKCQMCTQHLGTRLDGTACECVYGGDTTTGLCICCGGTGDSECGSDTKPPDGILKAAVKRKKGSSSGAPFPDSEDIDWNAFFDSPDGSGRH